jgi:hypothetical protein
LVLQWLKAVCGLYGEMPLVLQWLKAVCEIECC